MGNNSQSRKWSLVINNPLEAHRYLRKAAPVFARLLLHGRRDSDNGDISHACFLLRSIAVTLFYRQKAFPHSPY